MSSGGAATLHIGGGGEGLVYTGVGVGVELGYLGAVESLQAGLGIFSANGSYHFVGPSGRRKLAPFVTGGYSLGFREGAANMFNVGGGFNYWVRNDLGLRVEVRDHVWVSHGTLHLLGFRLGVVGR